MPSSMTKKRKSKVVKLLRYKKQALGDFYFFARNVLGYKDMVPHVHKELCAMLTEEIPRGMGEQAVKVILTPRGTFKSSVGTIAYSLWRLAREPNLRIMISNEKGTKAKKFLSEIKTHINQNPVFITLFGDWNSEKMSGYRWRTEGIDIAPRKLLVGSAGYSVGISSTEASATGDHYDLIICDDLVGKSNSNTVDQLDKVQEYVKDLGAILEPDGTMVFIGTRWHYSDIYGRQIDFIEEMGELANARVHIRSAHKEDGSLLFPERLSEQFLASQRKRLGPAFYNAQYENKIVTRETQLIKRIDKYRSDGFIGEVRAEKFLDACHNIVTVDLAYTDAKKSDSTAIVVNAIDPTDGKWYIRHYEVFKTTDPTEVVTRLFQIDDLYHPIRYGIEKNNYQSWLKNPLKNMMRQYGKYLNIDPEDGISHFGREHNKNLRLRVLAPQFNFGKAAIEEGMTELEDQLLLLTYDGVKGHDDLLDATAMQAEVELVGAGLVTTRGENDRLRAFNPREKKNPVTGTTISNQRKDSWMYA